MKIKKRNLISVLILSVLIATYFSITLKNALIAPIGQLIANFQEGNFQSNKYLLNRGINIELKKYEWAYHTKKMSDRIIVHFFGLALDNNNFKNQMADMHILDKNMTSDLFLKLSKVGMDECDKIIEKEEIKNNHLVNYTLCSYKGDNFIHYDIPSKKIMITFYPYTEDEKNKQALQEFLDGIVID